MLNNREKGLTLIELLVAMALGLFLVSAIGMFYATVKMKMNTIRQTQILNRKARIVLDMIARPTSMAGYLGCRELEEVFTGSETYRYPIMRGEIKLNNFGNIYVIEAPNHIYNTFGDGGEDNSVKPDSSYKARSIGIRENRLIDSLGSAESGRNVDQVFLYLGCDENKVDKTNNFRPMYTHIGGFRYILHDETLYLHNKQPKGAGLDGDLYVQKYYIMHQIANHVKTFKMELGIAENEEDASVYEYIDINELTVEPIDERFRRIRSVKYTLKLGSKDDTIPAITLTRVVKIENPRIAKGEEG